MNSGLYSLRPCSFATLSAAVYGIDVNLIDVEVDVGEHRSEKENLMTVGLPDAAVRESRQRIQAALKNCGREMPQTKVTINLAPADLKKEGSGFDLPMALGILGAYNGLLKPELPDYVFVGELMLDGSETHRRGHSIPYPGSELLGIIGLADQLRRPPDRVFHNGAISIDPV